MSATDTSQPRLNFASRREIEARWGVSRPTAERALRCLVAAGILERRDRRVFEVAPDGRVSAGAWLRAKAASIPALTPIVATNSENVLRAPLENYLLKTLLLELASGAYPPGGRFLSRRRIMRLWKVPGNTARKALDRLRKDQLLISGHSRLFIVTPEAERKASVLLGRLTLPPLPPPDTWHNRRRRMLSRSEAKGCRLAVVHDIRQVSDSMIRDLEEQFPPLDQTPRLHARRHLVAFLRTANRFFCETTFLCDSNREENTDQLVKTLVHGNFDGVALFHRRFSTPNPKVVEELKHRGIPMVTVLDRGGAQTELSINSNEVAGGYQAMRVLLGLGHRDILIMNGRENYSFIQRRNEGVELCLRDSGLGDHLRIRVCDGSADHKAARNARRFFRRASDRPSAILLLSLHVWPEVGEALHRMRVRIPGDLSVIGCGDARVVSPHYGPPDAVVRDVAELASQGARQLIRLIHAERLPPITLVLMPYLDRGTVGPPAGAP